MKEFPQKPKGKAINFKTVEEAWSTYKLADGNYMRVKLIVVKVLKTDLIRPDGIPIYNFESTNAITVLTPEQFIELSKSREV
jgi:hypothetical protein